MALTSKDSLLKALYGAGIQPAAMKTATGAAALTGPTAPSVNPRTAPRVSTPYTTPTYRAPTKPAVEKQPPVTIVNNPVPPPTPPLANQQTTYPSNPMQDYWNQYQQPAEGGPMSNVHSNPDGTVSYTLGGKNFTKSPQDFNAQIMSYSSFGEQTYGNKPYGGTYFPTYDDKGVALEGTKFGGLTGWPDVAQKLGGKYVGGGESEGGENVQENIQKNVGTPPYTGPKQSKEGYQYLNAQGKQYNGEDTAYWFNTADKKWYSGDKATNAITPLGSIAPWNTPPGGENQPPGDQNKQTGGPPGGEPGGPPGEYQYYGPGGGIYDPATDAKSYWYNKAEGIWYEGDTKTGKISKKMGGPPWEDVTSDIRFNDLIDKLSVMPYDKEYIGMMGGKLNEQLQAHAGTARDEIANRLGGAGVFGGAAQSQLRGVDSAAALGMSQGMGQIYQTAMGNAYEDRRSALNALQGKEWQNVQKMLGGTNAELQMAQLNQQGQQFTQSERNNMGQFILQLMANAEGDQWNQLMLLYQTIMTGGV